ncbi:MAG: flagellar protein FlaG [Gemmatimonadaceae bacterium]|nr:flagellar protein FlaG [Gemmatimonadaceae bacterium]
MSDQTVRSVGHPGGQQLDPTRLEAHQLVGAAVSTRRPTPGVDVFDHQVIQHAAGARDAYAKFSVDSETGIVSIEILDAKTNEVIRRVPADEVLKIVAELEAYLEAGKLKGKP